MDPYKNEPDNAGYQRTPGNPAKNPPQQQDPYPSGSPGGPPSGTPYQSEPAHGHYPPQWQQPPQGQYPPPGQYPPQGQYPPPGYPPQQLGDNPDDPCYRPKPAPKPPDPCKGVQPPEDPCCKPAEQGCTPLDPCTEYYESHDCSDSEGPCKCPDRPCDWGSLEGTIRQQLTAMEDLVNNPPPGTPADATTQLKTDLAGLETEYAGLPALVTTFETDRTNRIDCDCGKTRKWLEKLHDLCENHLHCDVTREDIREQYHRGKLKEREACCAYIRGQAKAIGSLTCPDQAAQRDADATADFALLKTLSATFITRLDALQTIFNNALAAADSRHYKTVCALHLEFHGLWVRLFTVETSCYRRKNCCVCCPPCELLPDTLNCWTVDRYRAELQKGLKALIAVKYDRYLWAVYTLKQQAEIDKLKKECDTISANRQARFLMEAEEARDCPTPHHDGDCGCGKHQTGA